MILVGAVDLSLGAGISLVTAVMASLMGDSTLSIVLGLAIGLAAGTIRWVEGLDFWTIPRMAFVAFALVFAALLIDRPLPEEP